MLTTKVCGALVVVVLVFVTGLSTFEHCSDLAQAVRNSVSVPAL